VGGGGQGGRLGGREGAWRGGDPGETIRVLFCTTPGNTITTAITPQLGKAWGQAVAGSTQSKALLCVEEESTQEGRTEGSVRARARAACQGQGQGQGQEGMLRLKPMRMPWLLLSTTCSRCWGPLPPKVSYGSF